MLHVRSCVLRQAQDEVDREWLLAEAIKDSPHPELVEGRTSLMQQKSMKRAAQQVSREDEALHFARAFADAADAHLAVPALEREVLGHAVAAMNLHGAVDDAAAGSAGDELRHRRFAAEGLAALGLVRGLEREPQAGFDVDLVADDHPLDRLARGERRAEGAAELRVLDRHLLRLDGDADAGRRIGYALAAQAVIGDGEAFVD